MANLRFFSEISKKNNEFFPKNPNISTISFPYPNYLLYLCRRFTIETMEEQNHIDKALAFLESLEKLGNQLKVAEENQKQFLARMLELKKSGETDSEEYADLSRKSKGLQDIIDKWRPIYLERMEMVKSVQMKKRKRTGKK